MIFPVTVFDSSSVSSVPSSERSERVVKMFSYATNCSSITESKIHISLCLIGYNFSLFFPLQLCVELLDVGVDDRGQKEGHDLREDESADDHDP